MTAHTPPTPPAARERKLDNVCFEASTTSFLTSSADGIEDGEDGEEGMAATKPTDRQQAGSRKVAECWIDFLASS
jgi:hypothetical protein